MEKEFNAQESLELIQGMINKAQNKFAENGFLYLLWGWTILICAMFQYVVLKCNIQAIKQPELVWFLPFISTIIQIIYLVKRNKIKTVSTYTDELIKYSWIVYGVTMMLISFIAGKLNLWDKIYPIIFVIYAIPTFLSGVIMQFTPLKIGAICCWALAVIATFVSSLDYLLLLSLAMITTWIIPGYLLKAKYKKENA